MTATPTQTPSKTYTLMRAELSEIPTMLQRQSDAVEQYWALGADLRKTGIRGIITCARGSSDHAATYFKYLMEIATGLPVTSIGASVASIYHAPLKFDGFALLSWSQSGGSPDLSAFQTAARAGGARCAALVNVTDSPLAAGAEHVLPLLAGPERAVAATKSFVAMLFAAAAIRAGFCDDQSYLTALPALPEAAQAAIDCDWRATEDALAAAHSIFCIGRGPGLAIASEAALKFKETCRLHAEAYSAAEVLHGPIAIASSDLQALVFDGSDLASPSIRTAQERLSAMGAQVRRIAPDPDADIRTPASPHPTLAPLLSISAYYSFVERLSLRLGCNPDAPEGLRKVTETV